MTNPLGLQYQRTTVSHKSYTLIYGNRLTKSSLYITLKSYQKKTQDFHFLLWKTPQVCAYLAASKLTSNCPGYISLCISKCGLYHYILFNKAAVFALIPMQQILFQLKKGELQC